MQGQNSDLRYQNIKTRYEDLEIKHKALQEMAETPRVVYEAKEIVVEKPVCSRIGQQVDALMDMHKSNNRNMHRQLIMQVLFLNNGYSKYFRLAHKCT